MMRVVFEVFIFALVGFVFGDDDVVTCGSVIKLVNAQSKARLHSHDVKYGSGSGQQSITGMTNSDDVNSHWQILGANKESCSRGTPVKCGDTIRFLHLTTKCLLHSHDFPAPLSKSNQEVSCFGKDGEGDGGDNWKVICNEDVWTEDDEVKFKHIDTGRYLSTSGQQFGRPISGQLEIVGVSSPGYGAIWKTAEGVYMQVKKDDGF
uniref:MIR domain-containing protein n=2 Tax=Panagrolaimus sp. JU765 TaxID=591449 RepID=A0AC34RCH1_9BILA